MQYRDMSTPYTEEEIAQVLETARHYPSSDANSVGTEDFGPLILDAMRYELTKEQLQIYIDYFNNDKHFGGRMTFEQLEEEMRCIHSPSLHAGFYARMIDTNHDGFISEEEFDAVYGLISKQWPKVAGKTFSDFLQEADTDKSGKVDIQEFVTWIQGNSS